MEIKGLNGSGVEHFTYEPEIRHFAEVKVNKNDNVYGVTWGNLVREYLKTAYAGEDVHADVVSDGVAYKVLRRREVTVFYDADGNTLFDVENKRLEKEHGYVMKELHLEGKPGDKVPDGDADLPADKTTTGKLYGSGEEKLIAEENGMIASVKPEYKKMMQAQMNLIFKELICWTKQDPEFEKKVLLSHKDMKRCMKFCADKAMGLREPSDQEKADARSNNIPVMTPVGSDMLFEWIKEYYDKDDGAEVEKEKKAVKSQNKLIGKKKDNGKKKTVPKEDASRKTGEHALGKERSRKVAGSSEKQGKPENRQISMFDLFDV